MNIQTVIFNLKNTIAGKEKLLADMYPDNYRSGNYLDEAESAVRKTTIEYLRLNIFELKRILHDVEILKSTGAIN
jgi:hypothetical protein